MEDALIFSPFQVKRKESFYRQFPVSGLERLYLEEFDSPDNENILSCGSALYGILDDGKVRRLRRFSDVDYMAISKNSDKKPYFRVRNNPQATVEVLTFGYDSFRKELENTLGLLLRFVRFAVPLFDSEDLYLEATSKAISKILEDSLFEEVLITPSYAMMKINDARMYYEPYRWWSVNGEFILSSNARRNKEVYYDRVASTMEKMCEEGSLIKVDGNYPESIYDTSKLVRTHRRTPILDMVKLYSEDVAAFLRGRNIPTSREIIHSAYDAINAGIGIFKRKNNCTALLNTEPQRVKVQIY